MFAKDLYVLLVSIGIIVAAINEENFLFQLHGNVDDSTCDIETIDNFNNAKVYPRIRSIILKDYFRFYKVNLKQACPFWKDGSHCAMRFCQVESCDEELVPAGIKMRRKQFNNENTSLKYLQNTQTIACQETTPNDLGYLNTTIRNDTRTTYGRSEGISSLEDFALWQAYDDAQDLYCTLPDEDGNAQYVDLILNPERYTGYRGVHAHRIWDVIYKENCFRPDNVFESFAAEAHLLGMCLEKRAFYRAISGLHASINVHLSAEYLLSDKKPSLLSTCNIDQQWGPNLDELMQKFAPQFTNNEGPQWLRNLYFLYLVELRALAKASIYLKQEEYYTGNDKEDIETQTAVRNLLDIINSFPNHFNESVMFSGSYEAKLLKEEFRKHFRNVSAIMDCVGCDKCKLWGKLQVQGLGTAFKILFSEKLDKLLSTKSSSIYMNKKSFQLERSEIVALVNAFARLSTSIYALENFRNMIR